jgi:hypothetical protein
LKSFITISFLLAFVVSQGQIIKVATVNSIETNERVLATLLDTAFHKGDADYIDSVNYEGIFVENLLFVLKSPKSFGYNFPLLRALNAEYNPWRISIIYSDDSLFRVFNWLSPTSGTWYRFPAVFQAINKNKKVRNSYPVYPEGSQPSTSYKAIYRLRSTPKQLYLCIGHGQGSGRLPFEILETYEITKDSIISADILPDSTHFSSAILVDRQSTAYDSGSQDIPKITFDNDEQVLTLPEIAGNYDLPDDVKWTGKLIQLKFNGYRFSKIDKAVSQHLEDRIIDTIIKLEEVKERGEYVKAQTNGRRHLQYSIWKNPSKTKPYYWVKVMEDNGVALVTHFNFYVYPKSMTIKYFDTVTNEVLDLKTWRKRKTN